MNDRIQTAVIRTRAERRRRISLIWAIPVVTLFIAAWLAWDTLAKRGPLITITFDSAAGLQANQSRIRYRDVDLGTVQTVALSPDRGQVIVTARMTRQAAPLLTEKAQFWVVKPRFFAGSITGLETLVSGAYIQFQPADVGGVAIAHFRGMEDPPVLRGEAAGHTFRLKTKRIGSLNLGSPVLFRDLTVGEVLGWDVGEMAREVTIHAFVRAPFDRYVHEGTMFWSASGASVQLGGSGVKLELESLRALILGGIAFDTPDAGLTTPVAAENKEFALLPGKDAADSAAFGRTLRFVTTFTGSVAGLSAGASVTLHGLRIGAVSDVALRYDKASDNVAAAVHYEVEPDRIARLELPSGNDLDKAMAELVARGLRVRLESASLVTGSKQMVMEIVAGAQAAAYDKLGDIYVIPAVEGDQGDIASSASALIARLNAIPFEQIGYNLNKTLAGASTTVNDPKLGQAIAALSDSLTSAQALIAALNKGADPLLRRLPAVASGLEDAVRHAGKLVASLDTGYGGASQFSRDTGRLLLQLTDAARSVRIVADLLSRHPESLIRGRLEQEVR